MENIKNGDRCDGSLIGQKPSKHDGKFCVFYHLMGQHGAFEERYPKEYDVFKGKEYGNHPPHQRDVLASYDNATLYNDFVVHSIMESYKDQDAIVFYVPDHGLDIFDTNPDFFGHAKKAGASQEQGKKIPFIVYVSPIFKELHAKTVKRMKKTTYKSFCTDKLIYAVMDVAGFRFEDNDDVNLFSMFL